MTIIKRIFPNFLSCLAGYIVIILLFIWSIALCIFSSSGTFTIPAMVNMGTIYMPNFNGFLRNIFSIFVTTDIWKSLLVMIAILLYMQHGYDIYGNTEFTIALFLSSLISNMILKQLNSSFFGYGPTAGLIALAILLFCTSTQGEYREDIIEAIIESIVLVIIACFIQPNFTNFITGLLIGLACGIGSIFISNYLKQ